MNLIHLARKKIYFLNIRINKNIITQSILWQQKMGTRVPNMNFKIAHLFKFFDKITFRISVYHC